jgi:predicted PurR-regulated permease PerM
VRSRLLLLVLIPLAAAAVIALCVAYIIDTLHKTQVNSNGSVMAALAAGALMIVVVLASLLTIVVARSVLKTLYPLRLRAQGMTVHRQALSSHPARAAAGVPPEFFLLVLFFDLRRRQGLRERQC